jgi:hypothetical protein
MPAKRRRASSPDAIVYHVPSSPENQTQTVPHFRYDAYNDDDELPRSYLSVPKSPTKSATRTITEDEIDVAVALDADPLDVPVDPAFDGYMESISTEPIPALKKRRRPGSVRSKKSKNCAGTDLN